MRPTLIIAAVGSVAALLTVAGQAQAQNNRSFVSGHGSDSNPCSLAAPCRTFAQAITQTNTGGEIAVLNTAGYGAVTITKSVSIVNQEGVEAGVTTALAEDGIIVTVGASDVVNLRGLTLVGGGVGLNGISFNGLGTLNVQNCVIRGFKTDGLALVPIGTAQFNISDTIASDIAGSGGATAVLLQPTGSGTVTAAFNRVQAITAAQNGFLINGSNSTGTIDVTIANSVATNDGNGIVGQSTSGGASTQVMVSNSVVSNNTNGVIESGTNSITYLAKNTIAGNTTAFSAPGLSGGQLFSFGDNYIKGNGNDGGAISLVAAK